LLQHIPTIIYRLYRQHTGLYLSAKMDRRARVAALAAKAGRSIQPAGDGDTSVHQQQQQKQVDDGGMEEEPESKRPKLHQQQKKSALEMALEETTIEAAKVVSATTAVWAPKKLNWDLKRDIQEKMEKLERRTQRAIVQLLRERLEQEAAEDNDVPDLD